MGLTSTTTRLSYARNELIKVGISFIFDKVGDMIYYAAPLLDKANTFTNTLTVGANTAGYDVKFFGDTDGSYLEWDADSDVLNLVNSTQTFTIANPTGAKVGVYPTINAAGATGWSTGTVAGVRGQLNIAVTAGGSYGTGAAGWFVTQYSAALAADGVGMTCGTYVSTKNYIAGKWPSSTLYVEDEVTSNGVTNSMPILVLTSKGTNSKTSRIAMEFGFAPAGTKVSYGTTGYTYYNETIRVKVNGSIRYLPLSTEEGTYTTDYPIVSTYGGGAASANAFTSTITNPTIDASGETSYGFSGTINAAGATGWSNGTVAPVFGQLNIAVTSPGDYGTGAAGWFELDYAAALAADGVGLTTGVYILVDSANASKIPCSVLYLEQITTGDGTASTMPMVVLSSKGGTDDKSRIAFSFGFPAAGTTVSHTTSEYMYYNGTIRCRINGTMMYLPFSTAQGTYTTAYPIVSTYAGGTALSFTATTAATSLKAITVETDTTATSGTHDCIYVDSTASGAGSCSARGIYSRVEITGNITGTCWPSAIYARLELENMEVDAAGACVQALDARIEDTSNAATMTAFDEFSVASFQNMQLGTDLSGKHSQIIRLANNGTVTFRAFMACHGNEKVKYLFRFSGCGGGTPMLGVGNLMAHGGSSYVIKCRSEDTGEDFYLLGSTDPALV